MVLISTFSRRRTANSFRNTSEHFFSQRLRMRKVPSVMELTEKLIRSKTSRRYQARLARQWATTQPTRVNPATVSTLIQCSDNRPSIALTISAMNSTSVRSQSSCPAMPVWRCVRSQKTQSRHLESQEQCSRQSIIPAMYDFMQVQRKNPQGINPTYTGLPSIHP